MKRNKGFTLLELIIVIIVVGILVAMAMPQFTKVAERGRIAKAKTVLDMFRKAEGIYFAINSTYSPNIDPELTQEIPELANVDDVDWAYTINSADDVSFEIEANRQTGEYTGETLIIDQMGDLSLSSHPLN